MNEARVHERLDELRTLLPADWTFAWMEQDDPAYAWVASASAPKLHRLGEGGDFIYAFSAATKAEALEGLIAEVRRRRNPRPEAPRTAHDAEARLGSFVHQMHPTKTLPEKEALQLHALLAEYRAAVEAEAASLDSDELRKAVARLVQAVQADHDSERTGVCHDPTSALALREVRALLSAEAASLVSDELRKAVEALPAPCAHGSTLISGPPDARVTVRHECKCVADFRLALLGAGDKAEAPRK